MLSAGVVGYLAPRKAEGISSRLKAQAVPPSPAKKLNRIRAAVLLERNLKKPESIFEMLPPCARGGIAEFTGGRGLA